MNREIKFRAWDGMDDVMRYDISVTVNGNAEASWGKEKYDWILMQYTGLKDSAGKEIYEGDIVEVNGLQYKIMFRGLGFWFVDSDNDGWVYDPSVYRITVIGNVFENPELWNEL